MTYIKITRNIKAYPYSSQRTAHDRGKSSLSLMAYIISFTWYIYIFTGVLDMLNMIPEDRNHKLSHIKNSEGNSILHELASSNDMEDGARELLKRAPVMVKLKCSGYWLTK